MEDRKMDTDELDVLEEGQMNGEVDVLTVNYGG